MMNEPEAARAASSKESRADLVLDALRRFARNGVVCELPSTVARWLGVSVDTVQRGIRDLLEQGRLERTPLRSGKAIAYRLVESPQPSAASPQPITAAAAPQAITAGGPPKGGPCGAAASPQACRYCLDAGFVVVQTRTVEFLRHFDAFGRRVACRDRHGRSEPASFDQEEYGPCPHCERGHRQEFPPEPSNAHAAALRITPPWGEEGFWRGRDTSHLRPAIEAPA